MSTVRDKRIFNPNNCDQDCEKCYDQCDKFLVHAFNFLTKEELIENLKCNYDDKYLNVILPIIKNIDLPDLTNVYSYNNNPIGYGFINTHDTLDDNCLLDSVRIYVCEITGYTLEDNFTTICEIPVVSKNQNEIKNIILNLYS